MARAAHDRLSPRQLDARVVTFQKAPSRLQDEDFAMSQAQ